MYACPSCKQELQELRCTHCSIEFNSRVGKPVFFTADPLGERYRHIAAFYDDLYQTHENVWDVVGRTPEAGYIASLVDSFAPRRYLDVCCGEGFLLASVSAPEKFGIDISLRGLDAASRRVVAHLCQGFVEKLPYEDEHFDVITNIGGMEHFLDDVAATREVHRVLRPGGRYLVLLLTETTLAERIRIKMAEYIYPRLRLMSLARWAWTRWSRKGDRESTATAEAVPVQPVQNHYSPGGAATLFRRNGFQLNRVITKRLVPDAPLSGHYIRLFVLAKPARSESRSKAAPAVPRRNLRHSQHLLRT